MKHNKDKKIEDNLPNSCERDGSIDDERKMLQGDRMERYKDESVVNSKQI